MELEQQQLSNCIEIQGIPDSKEINPPKVLGFEDVYTFRLPEGRRTLRSGGRLPFNIKDTRIKWSERLYTKQRVKRDDWVDDPDKKLERVKRIEESIRSLETPEDVRLIRQNQRFNDEFWRYQWYLHDNHSNPNLPRLDLNVLPVYAKGITGKGVRVSILDDGIEHNHTDLHNNYDPEISWDSIDRDPDPYPENDKENNTHGTRCAGEVAMTANNKKCGVGVAWGAKVGGVRLLHPQMSGRDEAEALGYALDKVDIYSSSWGPKDDGATVEGPGRLANEVLRRGVEEGRGGKGVIYVWANGNGGGNHDNCNCDGYSSSIYTIGIGSTSKQGKFPWYGEVCPSTLATAYSSGANDQLIATTDINDQCTLGHSGTSAAAPLAAGIIALTLEANPNLTWRDVQHLIVWTSEYAPLASDNDWPVNGVGLHYDLRFGFGLLNAGALVEAALNWTTVPAKTTCTATSTPNEEFTSQDEIKIRINLQDCPVKYMEHLELVVNIEYTRRGALEVYLRSPQGTEVQLLSQRPKDMSTKGFVNWPLTSVATWGEDPSGIWTIYVQDRTNEINSGVLRKFTLIVHGTAKMPQHMKSESRSYNYEYKHFNYDTDYNDILIKQDKNIYSIDQYEEVRDIIDIN
ncbi:neuroendocrine convertase 1-like [Aricia agestis]|uniref:neuroendocrine convertase 1-like n=1 Tax=Aricia agestis TaxID=91739 RepID=UPI001C2028D5|nr:neuroendocrine convertase 1-like [Aricia agestis]